LLTNIGKSLQSSSAIFGFVERKGISMRIKRYEEELQFAKQIWNRINKYLFNYIDAIILIDVLVILITKNPKNGVKEFEQYVSDISNVTEIAPEEIGKNMKRNSKS
jgi:Fe2+ transport system protein B